MSIWTYVSGSLELDKGPYFTKTNKDGFIKIYKKGYHEGFPQKYMPYPEEQFKLIETRPIIREPESEKEKAKPGFAHTIQISAFPIIKRDIDSLMEILPSGESDKIFYMLQEANFHRSSSSRFDNQQVEDFFKKVVMDKFPLWEGITWEEYNKYCPTELDWEQHIENAVLCIHDSIRWCEASEFYEKLMQVFTSLIEKEYGFIDGNFSIYSFGRKYNVNINSDKITVTITDNTDSEEPKTTYEYYQVFQYKDLSDPDDKTKRLPWRFTLKKVENFIDEFWPILEE